MKLFLFVPLLATFLLCADLEDHLKKVDRSASIATESSLRNIDFIYMINLDQRPEKWKLSVDQLAPYGITPCRFSAVNGWRRLTMLG
jgi:hypothetical protein